ncbi:MAG: Cell division protein FtsK [Schlesneria sp.]|nr:Cell division protein FtsK [Schlesneria sp.]
MFDYARLKTDLLALALLALAVFVGLSLASFDPADPPSFSVYPARSTPINLGGVYGASVAQALITAFGFGAYLLLAVIVVADIRLFARDNSGDPLLKLFGAGVIVMAACIVAQWFMPLRMIGSMAGSGGYVGAWGTILLDANFSRTGSLLLLSSMFLAGLLLTGEQHLVRTSFSLVLLPITIWGRLAFGNPKTATAITTEPVTEEPAFTPVVAVSPAVAEVVTVPEELSVVAVVESEPEVITEAAMPVIIPMPIKVKAPPVVQLPPEAPIKKWAIVAADKPDDCTTFTLAADRAPIRVNPPVGMKSATAIATKPVASPVERLPFQLPDSSLLEDAEAFPYDVLAAKAQLAAATLERTFEDFGLNVKVVEIDTGPVITQFELELEKGLRLSKVTALADDLAIALRVPSVRVVAPIPGKNTVGVEVPNDVRVMVRLKELLQISQKDFEGKGIPMFLGKDVSGKPVVIDMCKMPHLLIAGRTGTGKSVCLNTLILSMLLTRSPEQVKMLMIDPKMVELSPYSRIPHLMHPVITDMKKAEAVLGWAVDKMEERYDLLARVGVRHLDSYNQLGKDKVLRKLDIDPDSPEAELIPETMPYIVIIADEMADMMMTSGKDVEGHIIRLAQKSRAVGIHLVLATQKPTVDVITGLIKSNLPARISFQVASRMDSRVVLDEMGADKLLGNGDLLYMAPGTSTLRRAQGTYVSDDEVNRVIEFFADSQPEYDPELMQLQVSSGTAKGGKGGGEPRDRDDLYDQAVEVVIREGRGSVSLLQRALGVGYGRGARMIDWMAEDGIVGTFNGSQAREVVMTMDQWEESRDMVATR